ncbi:MAG: hypothetical protein ACTSUQ_13040, partial [Candidatus Freyarchaeota archaeon]
GKREAATHPKKPKKSKQPPHKTPKNFANLSPGGPQDPRGAWCSGVYLSQDPKRLRPQAS